MSERLRVCSTQDIEQEDVHRFDHEGRTFAIYHGPDGSFYATDGYCTHEKAHLADGIVDGFEIECPLHFGAFDYRTGDPIVAPVCIALKTYPVEIADDEIFVTV